MSETGAGAPCSGLQTVAAGGLPLRVHTGAHVAAAGPGTRLCGLSGVGLDGEDTPACGQCSPSSACGLPVGRGPAARHAALRRLCRRHFQSVCKLCGPTGTRLSLDVYLVDLISEGSTRLSLICAQGVCDPCAV